MIDKIKEIRAEIFRLIQVAPDLETVHWYISLDECFENDEFQGDEAENLRWRLHVLFEKKEPVHKISSLCESVLQYHGFLDKDKKWRPSDKHTPQEKVYDWLGKKL